MTLVARGAQRRGGGRDIISKSQAGPNHPAWPPVSGEGENVNTPAVNKVSLFFQPTLCGTIFNIKSCVSKHTHFRTVNPLL